MKRYTDKELREQLTHHLKDWSYTKGFIRRDFTFRNFSEAFSFMTSVALLAERADHHPDWSNVYNQVSISLRTHSVGGITQMDVDLAAEIDRVFSEEH